MQTIYIGYFIEMAKEWDQKETIVQDFDVPNQNFLKGSNSCIRVSTFYGSKTKFHRI
jgi:hypothetical protein